MGIYNETERESELRIENLELKEAVDILEKELRDVKKCLQESVKTIESAEKARNALIGVLGPLADLLKMLMKPRVKE